VEIHWLIVRLGPSNSLADKGTTALRADVLVMVLDLEAVAAAEMEEPGTV
jgi:hypothetical protein